MFRYIVAEAFFHSVLKKLSLLVKEPANVVS